MRITAVFLILHIHMVFLEASMHRYRKRDNPTLSSHPCWNVILSRMTQLKWSVTVRTRLEMERFELPNIPYVQSTVQNGLTYVEEHFREILNPDAYIFADTTASNVLQHLYEAYRAKNWNRRGFFIIILRPEPTVATEKMSKTNGTTSWDSNISENGSLLNAILPVLGKMFVGKVIFLDDRTKTVRYFRRKFLGSCNTTFEAVPANCTQLMSHFFDEHAPGQFPEIQEFHNCQVQTVGARVPPFITLTESKPFSQIDLKSSGMVLAGVALLFAKYDWNMTFHSRSGFCMDPLVNNIETFDGRTNYSCVTPTLLSRFPYVNTRLHYMLFIKTIVAVPNPKPIPEWQILFITFNKWVWIVQLAFMAVCAAILRVAVRKPVQFSSHLLTVLLMNLSLSANVSDRLLSTRAMLLGLLIGIMFVTNTFQARFTDLMAAPPLERAFESFEDLVRHDVVLYMEYLTQKDVIEEHYLNSLRWKLRGNTTISAIFRSGSAYLGNKYQLDHFVETRAFTSVPFRLLPSFQFVSPLGIALLVRDHPLAMDVNVRLGLMLAGGFVDTFEKRTVGRISLGAETVSFRSWNLKELECGISLALVGFGVSAVVLVGEILAARTH